jgi:two-component system cell cycle sensor histidine kinase/response regulator CckA
MIGMDVRSPDAPTGSNNPEPAPGIGILFVVLAVLTLLGLGTLVVVSARASDPILLAVLSVLGMIGSFFLFGLAAGHIRIGGEADADGGFASVAGDLIDHGIMITRRDGSTVYANAAYRLLAGTDQDGEPKSLEVAFAGEPQAAECVFRLMRAAELGEIRSEEFRVRDHDTRNRCARWLRLSVRPLKPGGLHRFGASARLWELADISSQRASEAEAIRSLETRIARYDTVPAGLLGATLDGRLTHLNPTLANWLGVAPETLRTRELTLSDIIAGDGEALLRAALARSSGDAVRLDLDLVREDGVGVPTDLVARISGGSERGTDISAVVLPRPRPADGPAGGEARFERLYHSAPFGIATLGGDGNILSFNAAFARMFFDAGLGAAGNIFSLFDAAGDGEALKAMEAAVRETGLGRKPVTPIEMSFGPEKKYTRRLYVAPVRDGQAGEAAMLYAIDATEQKALELKYAQSTKMEAVGKLAGGIAHDFNNVLTAILGFSDLLLQTHRPFDPAHKDIMNIKKEASRAADLVSQLLAFSRRQTLMPEVLDLGEVLTDLSVLVSRLIGEKIELKLVTGRDLWLIKADRTQLGQVIVNLAVNAKDAMPGGGRLTIKTRNISERDSLKLRALSVQPGEYLLIEVGDTGTGMPPEVMAKIFEPFFSTKDVGKGTGLGLSTVYGIVKQTGGYIFPESTPGKGTTFRVYLPRHVPELDAAGEPTEAHPAPPKPERPRDLTGTGRVLLVEDEDSVRNFAVRALKRQGYEVLEATTGLEALEMFAADTQPIDIVVSDVVMPEMDGPTMLTEMRKSRPDLKVIFVSGYPDDRFKTGLDPDAHYAFLAKPFSLPQLAAKVKEELSR